MLPRQTYQAAEYNPAKRKTLKRPAERQDIIDFVAEYIYSDVSLHVFGPTVTH